MLTAYISGRLGNGIIVDGPGFAIEGPRIPRRAALAREVAQLSAPESEYDVQRLNSAEDLLTAVDSATVDANALFLTLSCINPDLSIATRLLCAQAVDPLLLEPVRRRMSEKLLSDILPTEVRIEADSTLSYFVSFRNLAQVLRTLFESQETIASVEGAFQAETVSLTNQERKELRSELVHFGVFASLVSSFRASNANDFNTAVVTSLLRLKKSELNPLPVNVLTGMQRALAGLLRRQVPRQQSLRLQAGEERKSKTRRSSVDIFELLSADPLASLSQVTNFDAKTNVDKQITGIKRQILSGKVDLVGKFLAELVRFQIDNSEKTHLAKSLSLLASVALAANQLSIADEISLYALRLNVEDEVVFTTRAEVLKYLGRFDAALKSYRDTKVRFPEASYAWNGEADVLKEAGRYAEALSAYEKVRRRFSDDPVPANGFVATLRRMGRLREATKEAWKNIRKFPDDPVSRTELANVMSAAGRYKEAAVNYRIVLDKDPRATRALLAYVRALNYLGERDRALKELKKHSRLDRGPVLLNAIAIQYRIMGRLEEALQTCEQVVEAFPGYSPAKYTLASVLLVSGDQAKAITQLPKNSLRSESDWRAYRTYLTCMLGGDPNESVKRLEDAERDCVWPLEKAKLATVLAVAYARAKKTKESLKILEAGPKLTDAHHRQTRLVLLGALNVQLGRAQIGNAILTQILSSKDPSILNYKTSVLARQTTESSVIPLLLAA